MPYQFGPYRYDPVSHCLFRDDREIALRPKTRELLVLFLQHPHRLLTHDEIFDRLWPDTAVTDDAVRLRVFDLRKALGADAGRFVKTVPREGYRWESDVHAGVGTGQADGELVCRLVLAKREIELVEGEHLIGRDRGVAVWIDFSSVSRRHARILVSGGRATIEDLGSHNGTYVRGKRITGATELENGDKIKVGAATLVFRGFRGLGSTESEVSSGLS